ncbi:hypothetical protein VNO78_28645 [Psophocarpus tetragonolobus]|uniref:RNase H type-1 domain-containing protein n=1 Tax=Psophocarpus tetragonolobus TaxID=3891 RepID=A0AAN9WYL6_PSOTE
MWMARSSEVVVGFLVAEFSGMRIAIGTAMQIAKEKGMSKLWVESDSSVAVQLIDKGYHTSHMHPPLLNAIKQLSSQPWQVQVMHGLHEGNRVANCLAKPS